MDEIREDGPVGDLHGVGLIAATALRHPVWVALSVGLVIVVGVTAGAGPGLAVATCLPVIWWTGAETGKGLYFASGRFRWICEVVDDILTPVGVLVDEADRIGFLVGSVGDSGGDDPMVVRCSRRVVQVAGENPVEAFLRYFRVDTSVTGLDRLIYILDAADGLAQVQDDGDRAVTEFLDGAGGAAVPWEARTVWPGEFLDRAMGTAAICHVVPDWPVYSFLYVSPAGHSSARFDLVVDGDFLAVLVGEVAARNEHDRSVRTERAKVTARVRNAVKTRDNWTCQNCGLSVADEPNLLLEVDHIIPVSRGGKSDWDNLQTLCWRCNRTKSDRLV